ncbi:MAG TPA: HIT domain-containing protein [Acidimicrobiales bacterium]|nr:HIT domain-containing protein [Acidimicrobiales bacterium]
MPTKTSDDCTFCAIVAGRLPAHVVLDDEVVMAFLDVRPLFPGHTLVVPRDHYVTLTDLPADQVGPFFERVQWVTRAVEHAMSAAGSFVAMNNVVSQSQPHLHVHVVPRNRKDGLRGFFWPRTRYADDEAAAEVATTLRSALSEMSTAVSSEASKQGASEDPAAPVSSDSSGQGSSPHG